MTFIDRVATVIKKILLGYVFTFALVTGGASFFVGEGKFLSYRDAVHLANTGLLLFFCLVALAAIVIIVIGICVPTNLPIKEKKAGPTGFAGARKTGRK